jgi:hypothetical protein
MTDERKEFRIRCSGNRLHRVVFDGVRYVAPDHGPDERMLDSFTGRHALCESVAASATAALDTGVIHCHNDAIARHARQQAKIAADKVLRSVELPVPAETAVALVWTTLTDRNTLAQQPGTVNRHVINSEPTARSLMGRAIQHYRACCESRSKWGRTQSHGWEVGQATDRRFATTAIWDSWGRVILWHVFYAGTKYDNAMSAAGKLLARAVDVRRDNPTPSQQAALANLVLAAVQSFPAEDGSSGLQVPTQSTVEKWSGRFWSVSRRSPSILRMEWANHVG